MLNNLEDDYTGPFYLELDTEVMLVDPQLANTLEEFCYGRVNNLDRPGVTIFEFLDQGSAYKGVLVLQQQDIPFTLTGKNDLVFIVNRSDVAH